MTYQELTEGMSQWLNSQMRLAGLNRLLTRYFHGILEKNSKDDKPLIEAETKMAVNMLVWEANEAMRQELLANDPKTRDRTDMLCYSACSLISYLFEAGVISFRDREEWFDCHGKIHDRSTAFFLGLDTVEELEAEKRKKGLLPDLSTPRASLNLKRDSRGVKSEDDIVSELQEFLGVMRDDVKASQVLRCFLFGGEDDGWGMVTVPKANRLAWMLKELRSMGIYGFPRNVYQIAARWFLDVNWEMIKNMKVKACAYRDEETQARIKNLLLANISVN